MTLSARRWSFVGRFTLVHMVVYTLVALPFTFLQNNLPAANRVALDFFQPFGLDPQAVIGQALRGAVLGLLLLPFFAQITAGRRGGLILFGALWGLSLLGAVEPIPGSIEGVLYTVTTIPEHLLVLATGAVHAGLFCLLLLRWEATRASAPVLPALRLRAYLLRFTLLHVVTYVLFGILFMTFQDYAGAFATQQQFALFRPLDDPMMAAVIPIQIVRGAILAALLAPFIPALMARRHGWMMLFGLLFGFTALGSALLLPDTVAMLFAGDSLLQLLVGLPEVFTQMLIFAAGLFAWERRVGLPQPNDVTHPSPPVAT